MININRTVSVVIMTVLFLAIGIGLLIGSAVTVSRMNISRRVNATVTDVVRVRSKGHSQRKFLYAPVYEYYDNGELKIYKSSVSSSKAAEIGSEATLYIYGDGKIYERCGTAITLFVGVIFTAAGGVFAFTAVKMRIGFK
ncbi:MAG: hypothetical protein NC120_00475 [Ruminococcus sp.]|nr:hypothetical protein [Ruminococcus sp.]